MELTQLWGWKLSKEVLEKKIDDNMWKKGGMFCTGTATWRPDEFL